MALNNFYQNTSTMVTSDAHLPQVPTCICGVVYQIKYVYKLAKAIYTYLLATKVKYIEDYSSFYEASYVCFIYDRSSLIPQ